jgi:hypothetical protein
VPFGHISPSFFSILGGFFSVFLEQRKWKEKCLKRRPAFFACNSIVRLDEEITCKMMCAPSN